MRNNKICHLTTVHPPFDVRIFYKECKSLEKEGYKMILIAQNQADMIVDNVMIRALPKAENRLTRMIRLPWRLFKLVLKERPALCHFHDPELMFVGILCKIIGNKVIYDVHEDYSQSLLTSDRPWLPSWGRHIGSIAVSLAEWVGSSLFNGFIAATPAIAKKFPPEKTIVLQNYPIRDELMSENCPSYRDRSPLLIYTGGISPLRGARELIQSFDFLPDHIAARLVLAGKFDSPEFEKEIRKLPGWANVDFKGWVSRDVVARLLGQARIGLVIFHPVANHVEAQPNKLFEYMSAGIPVIASDFPLWREIVLDSGCGLLVDPLDPIKIAEAIKWLLQNPREAEAMGRRGQQAVEEKYNWDIEKKKLLTFYEKILA